MAPLLLSLLFIGIFSSNCGTAEEKTHETDFRPNGTSLNARTLKVHTDCQAAYDDGWMQSGLYTVSPDGSKQIDVFCEQTLDGAWTVFQKRIDGSVNFYRDWHAYKNGFGDIEGEFWLGNDLLHYLTSHNDKMLKVELRDGSDIAYADYSTFMVASEQNNYKLTVGGFSDTFGAGDSLTLHNGQPFTTKDRDNDDRSDDNCAQIFTGAWWYLSCHLSNLNGRYNDNSHGKGINWTTWKGVYNSLSSVRMMLKRK